MKFDYQNIACRYRHEIGSYEPGQVMYNLGSYPAHISMAPTDYDRQMLRFFADKGVDWIQLHSDWIDYMCVNGADSFSCPDEDGLKQFIALCHEYGLKVMLYTSSSYCSIDIKGVKPEWFDGMTLWEDSPYIQLLQGNCSNAEWRDFVYNKMVEILDTYDVDGLYNDMGYDYYIKARTQDRKLLAEGEKVSIDSLGYDEGLEIMLSRLYELVKSRGKTYKVHNGEYYGAMTKGKYYDYIYVGEGTASCELTDYQKDMPNYVVPNPDYRFDTVHTPDYYIALNVPYMRYPMLTHGRANTYEGIEVALNHPRFKINREHPDFQRALDARKFYLDHPDGPFVHSEWSRVPEMPEFYDVWYDGLALYKEMTKAGTVAYIEMTECDYLKGIEGLTASIFVNDKEYMVVSNFSGEEKSISLNGEWRDRVSGEVSSAFSIPNEGLLWLIKE